MNGGIEVITDPIMETFERIWKEVLDLDVIHDGQNFFEVGGDSLLAVRLLARCRENGISLTPKDIFTLQTFGALYQKINHLESSVQIDRTASIKSHKLLPSQKRWLDGAIADMNHFNLGWLFYGPENLTDAVLHQVAEVILQQHEALRTAYFEDNGNWVANVMSVDANEVVLEADINNYADNLDAMRNEIARAHESMNINKGIVFRMLHFPFGDQPGRLLVLVHHLTLDGFSLSVLADALEQALRNALHGITSNTSCSVSPAQYVMAVEQWLDSREASDDLTKWMSLPWGSMTEIPREKAGGQGLLSSIKTINSKVDSNLVVQLQMVAKRHDVGISELLLAAALGAISEWSGSMAIGVDVYHHGRDVTPMGIDVTQTIGYIQNTYPVILNWEGLPYEPGWFERIAEQFKRIPSRRFGFDVLRYSQSPGSDQLRFLPQVQIRYNFRGQMNRINERKGAILTPVPESIGRHRSPKQNEKYLLMLEGDMIEGNLGFGIKFSEDFYNTSTVQVLIEKTITLLNMALKQ